MSERDIEEIVAKWESAPWDWEQGEELNALIADWRAKRAEIERLKRDLKIWRTDLSYSGEYR